VQSDIYIYIYMYIQTHTHRGAQIYMPHHPHTHLALYFRVHCPLSQSWPPDPISCKFSHPVTTLRKYFTTWKLRLNSHKTKTILLFKRRTRFPDYIQIPNTFVSKASSVPYVLLVLDPKPLFTSQLHTVTKNNKRVL
jgi:hypothetical protein